MWSRDQLDEVSRVFAEKLFEKYPEWEAAARHGSEQPLSFCVEWESPIKGRSIGCSTENQEITVWFGDWHGHYGSWLGLSDVDAIELALTDVAGILNDEATVEATYRDGDWAGSTLVRADEEEQSSFLIGAGSNVHDASTVETRIQSWSGRLDQVKK